jgi:2-polyprenyl-6-methoxyphenol hydroxylase-like FAD-dependent oxidoreductase
MGRMAVLESAARFVVGCDGARSVVREAAGIEFEGRSTTRTAMLADVELAEPPEHGALSVHRPGGSLLVVPLPAGLFRLVVKDTERLHIPRSTEVTLEEVRESARRILGTDLGARNPVWLTRVGNAARLARAYRRGRIVLAGDAAHIHPPPGRPGAQPWGSGRDEPRLEARRRGERDRAPVAA